MKKATHFQADDGENARDARLACAWIAAALLIGIAVNVFRLAMIAAGY